MDASPDPQERSRSLTVVQRTVANLDDEQRRELYRWARQMQQVRTSGRRRLARAVTAVRLTAGREVVLPIPEQLKEQLVKAGVRSKRLLWDERSWASRLALGGAALAGAASTQGAGIAAFGGAVGVPLWLLTSSGGAALGTLIDELEKFLDHEDVEEIQEAEWEVVDRLLDRGPGALQSGEQPLPGSRLPGPDQPDGP